MSVSKSLPISLPRCLLVLLCSFLAPPLAPFLLAALSSLSPCPATEVLMLQQYSRADNNNPLPHIPFAAPPTETAAASPRSAARRIGAPVETPGSPTHHTFLLDDMN